MGQNSLTLGGNWLTFDKHDFAPGKSEGLGEGKLSVSHGASYFKSASQTLF